MCLVPGKWYGRKGVGGVKNRDVQEEGRVSGVGGWGDAQRRVQSVWRYGH